MNREEYIVNAARAYNSTITLANPSNVLHFEAGAKWADQHPNIESLWHDATEEPQDKNKQILSYSEAFDYFFMDFPNYLIVTDGGQDKTWETIVLRYKMSKWAYIADLLPKGGVYEND